MEATSDARCPSVCPLASTTYHFRLPARSLPLGKYVDIVNYLCFQRIKRERLEYKPVRKVVKQTGPTKRPFDMTSKGLAGLYAIAKLVTACRASSWVWLTRRFASASAVLASQQAFADRCCRPEKS